MLDASGYCEALVREADKDRFLAGLFAPQDHRAALLALYAFNVEITKVADSVQEALAGAIRLQWWRDVIGGQRSEEAAGHPVASELLAVIDRHQLPQAYFETLIDARQRELDGEPMRRLDDLETHARDTAATLIELSGRILASDLKPVDLAFAEPAGKSMAIAGVLRALGFHAARGDVYIPGEVLARHGVDPHELLAGQSSAGLVAALADLRGRAAMHYEAARVLIGTAPAAVAPAWLPVALVPAYLKAFDRNRDTLFQTADVPQWRRQWLLWRAARAGRLGAL